MKEHFDMPEPLKYDLIFNTYPNLGTMEEVSNFPCSSGIVYVLEEIL